MDPGRQPRQHVLLRQYRGGRIQLFKILEVVKNLFGDGIHHVNRYLSGGDNSGPDAEGIDIFGVFGIRV